MGTVWDSKSRDDSSSICSQLSNFKLSVAPGLQHFTTADDLMPVCCGELEGILPFDNLQPAISLDGHIKTDSNQCSQSSGLSNSTATSLPDSLVNQRKSSLSKIKVAPLNIRNISNYDYSRLETSTGVQEISSRVVSPNYCKLDSGSHRSSISSQRHMKRSPITPPTEFASGGPDFRKPHSDNQTHSFSPQTPKSLKFFSDERRDEKRNLDVQNSHDQLRLIKISQHHRQHSIGSGDKSLESFASVSSLASATVSKQLSDSETTRFLERMRQRHNVARELYYTERQFAQDMAVVVRIYMCGSANLGLSMRQIDNLFSNVTHVMDVSLSLVAILETQIPAQILHGECTVTPLDIAADKELRVGKAMCLALTGQFYEVYETYIHGNRNQMDLCYDLNISLGRKTHKQGSKQIPIDIKQRMPHLDQEKLKIWLQRSQKRAEKFTTGWSLDSLLIKPIQRLGKYPLFLKTLLHYSYPQHDDYDDLQKALKRSMHYLDCVNARYESAQTQPSVQ